MLTYATQPSLYITSSTMGLLCESVMYYKITYAMESDSLISKLFPNTYIMIVYPTECSLAKCSHSLTGILEDYNVTKYSVSVTAVGLGVTSDTKTVGM